MDGWQILERARQLRERGEAFALATVVWRQGPSSGQQGSRAIITAGGELHGWIGGACAEPAVMREAREVIAEGAPRLLLLGSAGHFGDAVPEGMHVVPIACQSEGSLEVYIEPVVPEPHLIVVGKSPMAHALAEMGAALGWRAELIDVTQFTAANAGRQSMVVVATQGHGDEEAVQQAAVARPAYLGLIGSRKRGTAVLGYLAERGVPAGQLERVRVPAGLDLGHTPHREIAVAVLAELVQLRASGVIAAGAASLSAPPPAGDGAPAGQAGEPAAPAGQPGQAIDPVCGMTVTADRASLPLEYQGTTYYFCQAGCRRAFESDPAAYLRNETRC
ncbi:MAG TPA: XdhC family protein [Streptosporangiaceae bacterium]|jgi:xanthine dehydrogenase accessory factor